MSIASRTARVRICRASISLRETRMWHVTCVATISESSVATADRHQPYRCNGTLRASVWEFSSGSMLLAAQFPWSTTYSTPGRRVARQMLNHRRKERRLQRTMMSRRTVGSVMSLQAIGHPSLVRRWLQAGCRRPFVGVHWLVGRR
jgi:hypothetical protein